MVEIDIPIYCNRCGRGICHLVQVRNGSFYVDLCEDCQKQIEDAIRDQYTAMV